MDLARYSLDRINAEPLPTGKIPGENFGRLSSDVARVALVRCRSLRMALRIPKDVTDSRASPDQTDSPRHKPIQ